MRLANSKKLSLLVPFPLAKMGATCGLPALFHQEQLHLNLFPLAGSQDRCPEMLGLIASLLAAGKTVGRKVLQDLLVELPRDSGTPGGLGRMEGGGAREAPVPPSHSARKGSAPLLGGALGGESSPTWLPLEAEV